MYIDNTYLSYDYQTSPPTYLNHIVQSMHVFTKIVLCNDQANFLKSI